MKTKINRSRVRALIIFAVISALIMGSMTFSGVFAATVETNPDMDVSDAAVKKLEDKLAKLESDNAALEKKITDAKANIADTVQYKEDLDALISQKSSEIQTKQDLIIELNNSIRATENRIAALEADNSVKYENFKEWLRIAYEDGNVTYLEMLLESESFSDFLMSAERIANRLEYESGVMDELEQQAAQLSVERQNLEDTMASAKAREEELQQNQADLEAMITEADAFISQQYYTASVSQSQIEENQQYQDEIDAEIEAILVERQNRLNAAYAGGPLLWPTESNYNVVSSGYGWRNLYGTQDFHLGIDIPCAYGSAICAANAGTVVTAAYHYSYGYYVLIDHGGGLTTLYSHLNAQLVYQGQEVYKGDAIAEVGSTGLSTGPHLDFSVRVNGEPVDPMGYF